jgi:hypothetical protein
MDVGERGRARNINLQPLPHNSEIVQVRRNFEHLFAAPEPNGHY